MHDELRRLGREKGKHQARAGYSAAYRRRVGAAVRRGLAAGMRMSSVAELVGVSTTSLRKWSAEEDIVDMVPVHIVREASRQPQASCQPVLVFPSGLRVEGLGAEEVVGLLRGWV